MASSTRGSATELGGGLRPPSDGRRAPDGSLLPASPSDEAGLRGQSPRSDVVSSSRGTSLTRDAIRRLLRNRLAMAGLIVVVLMCFTAVFAEVLAPYSYTKANFSRLNEPPSRDHWLGTDQL